MVITKQYKKVGPKWLIKEVKRADTYTYNPT